MRMAEIGGCILFPPQPRPHGGADDLFVPTGPPIPLAPATPSTPTVCEDGTASNQIRVKVIYYDALAVANGPSKADALAAFERKWANNPLVMDKWFAVRSATASVGEVAELLEHKDFDLGNPNRVRSVVAVFAMQNLPAFHARDGSGYRLVTDIIARADQKNPALAARLLTAFEQWKSLEPAARGEAESALKALQAQDLSKNAADIITRTLGERSKS